MLTTLTSAQRLLGTLSSFGARAMTPTRARRGRKIANHPPSATATARATARGIRRRDQRDGAA